MWEIYILSVQKSWVFILCLNLEKLVSSLREFGKEFGTEFGEESLVKIDRQTDRQKD